MMAAHAGTYRARGMSLQRLHGQLIVLCCLFPWSSPVPVPSDTQPLALLLSLLYVLFHVRRLPTRVWPLVLALMAALALLASSPTMDSVRGALSYVSLLAVLLSLGVHFRRYGPPSPRFYGQVLLLWGAIGLVQFWVPEIVTFLSSREGVFGLTAGRGSMSFAPEPTFYGIWLLLLGMIMAAQATFDPRFDRRKLTLLLAFTALQIVLLSRSTLVLLLLVLLGLVMLVLFQPWVVPLVAVSVFAVNVLDIDVATLIFGNGVESRALLLLERALGSGWDLLSLDGSVSDRVVQIVASHYFFLSDFGLPHGFESWSSSANRLPDFLATQFHSMEGLNRVLSFSGGMLFELGVLAVPAWIFMIRTLVIGLPGRGLRWTGFKLFAAIMILVQAIPVALPTVPYLLAIAVQSRKKRGR